MDEGISRERHGSGSEWASSDADAAEAFSEAANPEVDDSMNPTAAAPYDQEGETLATGVGTGEGAPATDGGMSATYAADPLGQAATTGGELGAEASTAIPISGPMGASEEGPELEGHVDSPGAGSRTVDDPAGVGAMDRVSGGSGDEWRESVTPDQGAGGLATDYGSGSGVSGGATYGTGASAAGSGGEEGASGGGASAGGGGPAAAVAPMVGQLQSMIENVTTQAAPVLRQIAAKAAELAAVAGERAGPIAQKAAEKTQQVGETVATRGREAAANLRQGGGGADPQPGGGTQQSGGPVEEEQQGQGPASGPGL